MKKIYTKGVLAYNKTNLAYELIEEESDWYYINDSEMVSECGGSPDTGGQQQVTSTEKSEPWEKQQPYLLRGFNQAEKLFMDQAPPAFYPGSTVVPNSPETNLALQLQTQRAIQGSPIQAAGTNQLAQTLRGDYLKGAGELFNNPVQQMVNSSVVGPTMYGSYLYDNPGFNAAFKAASNKIIPMVDSSFEQAGRTGSGLAQTAKTQALSDAFASQYGQERQNQMGAAQLAQQGTEMFLNNINNERENQIRSMLFAPQLANLDYTDYSKLAEVGAQKESIEGEKVAEDIARYDYSQNAPAQQLAKFMNMIQGNYGGTATGSSTSTLSGGGGGGGNFLGSAMGLLPMLFGGGLLGF